MFQEVQDKKSFYRGIYSKLTYYYIFNLRSFLFAIIFNVSFVDFSNANLCGQSNSFVFTCCPTVGCFLKHRLIHWHTHFTHFPGSVDVAYNEEVQFFVGVTEKSSCGIDGFKSGTMQKKSQFIMFYQKAENSLQFKAKLFRKCWC